MPIILQTKIREWNIRNKDFTPSDMSLLRFSTINRLSINIHTSSWALQRSHIAQHAVRADDVRFPAFSPVRRGWRIIDWHTTHACRHACAFERNGTHSRHCGNLSTENWQRIEAILGGRFARIELEPDMEISDWSVYVGSFFTSLTYHIAGTAADEGLPK